MQVRGSGRGAIVPTGTGTTIHLTPTFWRAGTVSLATSSRVALTHAFARHLAHSPRPRHSLTPFSQAHNSILLLRAPLRAKFLLPHHHSIAATMATTSSAETPEWSAQRVRDTFLKYFEERGHTFGTFVFAVHPNDA